MMMRGDQLYELDQIREQESMLEAAMRRAGSRRTRARALGLITAAGRRLRRRGGVGRP
ncbi:MAG: hypothetical protein JF887_13645 [Candidatus Dormibacteraeota bacterium]|uniref:Uncharacterized protein n=1 Tax=Candidatus Amunia macphersoniae TaxID=3127014 RepID=A0A934KSR5_9BACT|nr:hypothetical protein [Candidatus Dormibacteraeota bacterium]